MKIKHDGHVFTSIMENLGKARCAFQNANINFTNISQNNAVIEEHLLAKNTNIKEHNYIKSLIYK